MTERIDVGELFRLFVTRFRRVRGVPGQIMASSSVASIVRAVANDSGELMHAPGPGGLVGGYPLRIGAHKVELALYEGLSLDEAITVNRQGQKFKGIERIDEDGTVHFADRQMAVMKRILGYECRSMKVNDVDHWAAELGARYQAFVGRIGACAGAGQAI